MNTNLFRTLSFLAILLIFGLLFINVNGDGASQETSDTVSSSNDSNRLDEKATESAPLPNDPTPDHQNLMRAIELGLPDQQPKTDRDEARDPAGKTQINGLQADLARARAQTAQAVSEKAAALTALRSLEARLADHDKQLEAEQKQASALTAELADARRGADQVRDTAKRLENARAAGDGLQADLATSFHTLPKGAPARVVLLYLLGSDTARIRAIAFMSTLTRSGTDVTSLAGMPETRPGTHVIYYYQQDQEMAKRIATNLSVPEPLRSHAPVHSNARPGTIELSVGG